MRAGRGPAGAATAARGAPYSSWSREGRRGGGRPRRVGSLRARSTRTYLCVCARPHCYRRASQSLGRVDVGMSGHEQYTPVCGKDLSSPLSPAGRRLGRPQSRHQTPTAVHIPTPGSDRDRDRFPTGLWGRGRSAQPVWPDGPNPRHSAHPQMNFSSRRRGERRRRRGCRSTRRAGPGCVHPYGPTGP